MQDVTVVDNQDILLVNAPSNVRAAVVSDVVLVADKVNVISAVVGFLNLFLIFSELTTGLISIVLCFSFLIVFESKFVSTDKH